ncbi:hypothetical protein [Streptomyces sp. NPDC017890]|uniref:hypothetical protein n=1 Tax=Streptomyces sp. NPDC017890 TaxID=3365015 RepID=UPI0037BD037F
MRQSSWVVIAALAVSVPCAAPAKAAVPRAPHLPGDVPATGCGRGVAAVVVPADGEGTASRAARRPGGTHDGETVTRAGRLRSPAPMP